MKAAAYHNRSYWLDLHTRERGAYAAVGYHLLGNGFNRAAYRIRKRAAERILQRNAVSAGALLEAGVGIGAYAGVWQKRGMRQWTGVDISPAAVESLGARFPQHRFLQLDLTRERVAEGGYDLVTAIDVLYHLVEAGGFEYALDGLAEAVRPGGYLLLSDLFCAEARRIEAHVERRPLAEYQRLLARRGLRLADREPVFAILGDPAPRAGRWSDQVLAQGWRAVSKLIRCCPQGWAREAAGAALATVLTPVDDCLRATGMTRGVNLELALFRREGGRQ